MTDWEAEVKSGEPFHVKVDEGKAVIIEQAFLGRDKKGIDKQPIHLHLTVDGERFVAGILHPSWWPRVDFKLRLDKDFDISHTLRSKSVFFSGLKVDQVPDAHRWKVRTRITYRM
ncbi:hypothetical protein OROMI_021100 [Orobanche minor]